MARVSPGLSWFIAIGLMGGGASPGAARTVISSPEAPQAIGPYVQAVAVGDTLYLSGQIALDPKTGEMIEGDIRAQTRQVLENLRAVLAEQGMTLDDAVSAQLFMTDLAEFQVMNEVYAEFFQTPPARTTVEVQGLPRGALIAINLIAVRQDCSD